MTKPLAIHVTLSQILIVYNPGEDIKSVKGSKHDRVTKLLGIRSLRPLCKKQGTLRFQLSHIYTDMPLVRICCDRYTCRSNYVLRLVAALLSHNCHFNCIFIRALFWGLIVQCIIISPFFSNYFVALIHICHWYIFTELNLYDYQIMNLS